MAITSVTLDRVINKVGSPYAIYIGSTTFDIYGFGSVTLTGSVANGYVYIVDSNDERVREGILAIGDAIGYFKMDASFPVGSKIEIDHQGVRYEAITDARVPHLSGAQLMREIDLRKKV